MKLYMFLLFCRPFARGLRATRIIVGTLVGWGAGPASRLRTRRTWKAAQKVALKLPWQCLLFCQGVVFFPRFRNLRSHRVALICVADSLSLLRSRRFSRRSLVLQIWKVLRNRFIPTSSKYVTAAEAEFLLTSRKLLLNGSLATTPLIWILPPLVRDGVVMIAQSLHPDGRSLSITNFSLQFSGP